METAKTSLYFPVALWKKVRLKAMQEDKSTTGVLTELLERWVKGEIKLEGNKKEKLAA